jgi:CubicO group peptidase (beta-lactamase class C family)
MWSGQDIVRLVLGKPVVAEPGAEFLYSNGISTVLGAIIKRASHMEVAEFAEKYLFAPLDIEDYHLQAYPDGTTDTDGNLALRPRDLTKIGQMFLDNGRYKGAQIVSEEWVQESMVRRVEQPDQRWYGYQWWHMDFEMDGKTIAAIHSSGWGGQYVFIFPELDLIVVAHGANFDDFREEGPFRMLKNYILPAVLSSMNEVASPPLPNAGGGAGSSDPRVAEIEALMAAYEQADIFSGAVLVAEGDEVPYEGAVGSANGHVLWLWLWTTDLDRARPVSLCRRAPRGQIAQPGAYAFPGRR